MMRIRLFRHNDFCVTIAITNLKERGRKMGTRQAEILLFAAIAARSASYLFSKISMDAMPPMELLGIRFLLAALVLGILFYRRILRTAKEALKPGILAGIVMVLGVACELAGLSLIDSSTVAFLENTAVLWVLLISSLCRWKLPGMKAISAMILVLAGISFLTMKGSGLSFSAGEIISLGSSLFYALWILLLGKYADKTDPVSLGFLQMLTMGILGLGASLFLEKQALPEEPSVWAAILGLALLCSVFSVTAQSEAQKWVSSEKAGFFSAASPMLASLLGWIFLGESMTSLQILGAGFITASLLLLQLKGFGNMKFLLPYFRTHGKYRLSAE